MSHSDGRGANQRSLVFRIDSVPSRPVSWGRTQILIGRDAEDEHRRSNHVLIKMNNSGVGDAGKHELHSHPDQDEILVILEGRGENESADGFIQQFGLGDVVYIPAGTPHADRSVGGSMRYLVIKVPPD